jgi:hypothetical protein
MSTLWNPRRPLNQPPHFGGLSLTAGKAERTTPHSSIAVNEDEVEGLALIPMSDQSDNQEQR